MFVRIGAVILLQSAVVTAGPLTPPPGPIAPAMKTLSEVEPRTAINAVNTPGDSDSLFKITQPGSYYLTGNITGEAAKCGIEIAASNVVIDLMGFTLTGVSGSLDGINTSGLQSRITIRNGTITTWFGNGISIITGGTGSSSLIESVHAASNMVMGIRANDNTIVRNCTAEFNGTIGINLAASDVITNCTSRLNGAFGISSGTAAVISGCAALSNGNAGISAGPGSTVTDCIAIQNTSSGIFATNNCLISNCTARLNGTSGIGAGNNCTIINCISTNNTTGAGISIASACTVMNSQTHSNTGNAGILCSGNNCRLDANTSTGNLTGIRVTNSGNIITRNTCSDNTTNWDISANNYCLVINGISTPAFSGNSGGAALGSTDPNANFTY